MNRLEQIALTKIKGVGPKTARRLLEHFPSVKEIFQAKKKELEAIPGIHKNMVDALLKRDYFNEAEEELTFIDKHQIETLWIGDDNYPKLLKQCEDAPLTLYFKGKGNLNPPRSVSIVGTRNATAYGKKLTEELIERLAGMDIQIISGLAYGIDVHAHRLALKHNIPTVGVLGHGLSLIYPAAHRETAAKMLDNGGLLTEFTSSTQPDRPNFPARNRIIAGISDVTIVVEAAIKGGALITAEIANSYNRDVCSYPGAVDQEYSAGCNYLIKTNRAHLVRNAEDLIYIMGWDKTASRSIGKQLALLPPKLPKDQLSVYNLLREREQSSIDDLVVGLDMPMSKLALTLLEMELAGHIISLPGKIYKSLI